MSSARTPGARLAAQRLRTQQLSQTDLSSPQEVVAAFGAIQAQDLAGSRWAVGLRLPEGAVNEHDLETALNSGSIIRTHAMRGTWQLIAPEDVRWLIALVGPRTLAKYKARRQQLGLSDAVLKSCNAALRRALGKIPALTRAEIRQMLARAKVPLKDEALSHLLMHAELTGVVCSGPRRGKQSTHALLDVRVPSPGSSFTKEEAARELARRYLSTRGPAQVDDFAWWSGLMLTECRAAFASLGSEAVAESLDDRKYYQLTAAAPPARGSSAQLVPAFDEYLVSYRDRSAVIRPEHSRRVNGGGGMLNPCVLVDGQVVGLWRRTLRRNEVDVALNLFERPSASEQKLLTRAAERYANFLDLKLRVRFEQMQGSVGANGRWMFR
jgi:hypothetical protein